MSEQEREEFLQSGAIFAKIGTTNEDGWPMVSPVWYEWTGSSFLIVGKGRTSYVRNLKRDPRCAVLVDNPVPPYKRVSLLGVAEFLPQDFDWQTPTRRMVSRYVGEEGLADEEASWVFPRVPIRIWPKRMTSWNGGGIDRTFRREAVWHEVGLPPWLETVRHGREEGQH